MAGSLIPVEPMYLILNTAISHRWGMPEPCPVETCPVCWRCFDCLNPGILSYQKNQELSWGWSFRLSVYVAWGNERMQKSTSRDENWLHSSVSSRSHVRSSCFLNFLFPVHRIGKTRYIQSDAHHLAIRPQNLLKPIQVNFFQLICLFGLFWIVQRDMPTGSQWVWKKSKIIRKIKLLWSYDWFNQIYLLFNSFFSIRPCLSSW